MWQRFCQDESSSEHLPELAIFGIINVLFSIDWVTQC